jgi:AraC-like DNA-binding protein
MTQLTFTEFEAFAEAVREASVTMRITALEQRKWTLRYAVAGSLRLQQGHEGGGNIAEGVTYSDGWTFYYQPSPVFANGQVITGAEVFTAPPRSEFCLASHPSHEWLTLFVPTTLLFPSPQALECVAAAKPHVLKPPPQVTRLFTSLVRRFLAAAENHPQLMGSPVALNYFEAELLAATKELFTKNQRSPNRNFMRWHCQTKATLELAMRHLDEALSVADLAKQLCVPERTLRTAFQRCYGLSPIEYLRVSRLHQARRLLLGNCPDATTVTQIAFGLGFWDLGRFAGSYRQLFGELPSESLRKSVRGSNHA